MTTQIAKPLHQAPVTALSPLSSVLLASTRVVVSPATWTNVLALDSIPASRSRAVSHPSRACSSSDSSSGGSGPFLFSLNRRSNESAALLRRKPLRESSIRNRGAPQISGGLNHHASEKTLPLERRPFRTSSSGPNLQQARIRFRSTVSLVEIAFRRQNHLDRTGPRH